MHQKRPLVALTAMLGIAVLVFSLALSPSVSPPLQAQAQHASSVPVPVPPAIGALWQQADGPVMRQEEHRAWLLGPGAVAAATEHDSSSPIGVRQEVYFDKARLDISDPSVPVDSPWYAVGAQLVTEMLAGSIQVGSHDWIPLAPANIAAAGDPLQPGAITYATLARHATLPVLAGGSATANASDSRVGQQVTAVLDANGNVSQDAGFGQAVTYGAWNETTRHNVAMPFVDWDSGQPFPENYLLGLPLTEPFWIEVAVGGTPTRMLIQAFERRVLTWTPSNDPGYRVETSNTGIHYREWRGLSRPADAAYEPLATLVPYGENIVQSATSHGIDPWLLAAVADVASGGNPLAVQANGGSGLLGMRHASSTEALAPGQSTELAAAELARLAATNTDDAAMLSAYFGDADPAQQAAFVADTLATRDALRTRYAAPGAAAAQPPPLPVMASGVTAAASTAADSGAWGQTLAWYGSWGGAVAGWQLDPHGFYCAWGDFAPGDRLRLISNGASLDCTVALRAGDLAAPGSSATTLALSRDAFDALGLGTTNAVSIAHLGLRSSGGAARQVDGGGAAFYASSFDRSWWDWVISYHANAGRGVAGWSPDPNGYYCVHPGFVPGQRLRLIANGVTLDCTIGDLVASHDVASWQSRWAVELSWDTFKALGLDRNNSVSVYAIP